MRFVSRTCAKSGSDGSTRRYYQCHRSGRFKSHGVGKRRMKVQGSCRTGVHCMATVACTQSKTGVVTVVYQKTHYGHEIDLSHLRLSRAEREVLMGLLSKGLPYSAVVAEARRTLGHALSKIHLIKKKDLHNLNRSRLSKQADSGTEVVSVSPPSDDAADCTGDSTTSSACCEESAVDCITGLNYTLDKEVESNSKQNLLRAVRELYNRVNNYVGGDDVLGEVEQHVLNLSHRLDWNSDGRVVDVETVSLKKRQQKERYDHVYSMKLP